MLCIRYLQSTELITNQLTLAKYEITHQAAIREKCKANLYKPKRS